MSHYYPLSPVQRYCPPCSGLGRVTDELCRTCDGVGRTWIEGGPDFGCRWTLDDVKPGHLVELGNGDRGRVIRHCDRGSPTTDVILFDPNSLFDEEMPTPTTYPRETGVRVMSATHWQHDDHGVSTRCDELDPMRRGK